jgi:ABC-type dipeptide/oligopeptide/nickel transport systems, permease components
MSKGRLSPRSGITAASAFLLLLTILAIGAPAFAPFDPVKQDAENILASPGTAGHLLGTDDLGRDLFSRIIYGSRSALMVGLIASLGSSLVGSAFGLAAGLGGRAADAIITVLMDGLLSFPTILAAMLVVAVLGFGLGPVTIALAVIYSPVFARLVRTQTQIVKGEGYIAASRAFGFGWTWIVFRHVIPNIAGKIIVQIATVFALAVSVEASLSYLGLGTQPPAASWGLLLKDARSYIALAPWLSVWPGLAVFLTVLAASALGDGLAKKLERGESNL